MREKCCVVENDSVQCSASHCIIGNTGGYDHGTVIKLQTVFIVPDKFDKPGSNKGMYVYHNAPQNISRIFEFSGHIHNGRIRFQQCNMSSMHSKDCCCSHLARHTDRQNFVINERKH